MNREREAGYIESAEAALKALRVARTPAKKLAAVQALESTACQFRRALKKEIG